MTTPYTLDDPLVPTRSARQLVRLFEHAGVNPTAMLSGMGLDRRMLESDQRRLTGRQMAALIRNGLRDCDDVPIGLEAGRHFSISDFGLLGYAMMSAQDVAGAIRIAERYHRTAGSLFELGFDLRPGELQIRIEDVFELRDSWPFVVEQFFSSLRPLLLQLLGHAVTPLRVTVNYDRSAHAAAYARSFACPVRFSAPVCVFTVAATVLRLPLHRANADVARMFEASCSELLTRIHDDQRLAGRITRRLLAHSGPPPGADEMARVLNMGSRTLRRKLASEQTSYQRIVDEVRRRLALDYLRTTTLTVQEIAELLGYTESTNFRRAFMKWTGESPSRYRRHQRAQGPGQRQGGRSRDTAASG